MHAYRKTDSQMRMQVGVNRLHTDRHIQTYRKTGKQMRMQVGADRLHTDRHIQTYECACIHAIYIAMLTSDEFDAIFQNSCEVISLLLISRL